MKKQSIVYVAFLLITFSACKKYDVAAPSAIQSATENITANYNAAVRGMPTAQSTAEVPATWYPLLITLNRTVPGQSAAGSASRSYAYIGLALYESVVPGMPKYQSLHGQLSGMPEMPQIDMTKPYYYPASANAAIAGIVHHLYANASTAQQYTIDSLEQVLYTGFQSTVPQEVLDRSVQFGKAISDAIYDWSKTDGGDQAYLNVFPPYTPPQGPQYWVPQPTQSAMQPYWADEMRTFIPNIVNTTQPPPPIPYSTNPNSEFYREEMQLYKESINQDPEHKAAALYWASVSGINASISITNTVVKEQAANLATAAEVFCRVGIALSDGIVSNWKTKYTYVQVRPITYIRANFDPNWSPTIPTPPYPDYSGGYTAVVTATSTVLSEIFGNNTSFTCTYINGLGFEPRMFNSFSECVREVARSRFWAGVHIMSSNYAGFYQGGRVGIQVNGLQFKKSLPE